MAAATPSVRSRILAALAGSSPDNRIEPEALFTAVYGMAYSAMGPRTHEHFTQVALALCEEGVVVSVRNPVVRSRLAPMQARLPRDFPFGHTLYLAQDE